MESSGFGKMLFAILLVCLFVCASAYSQTGTSSVVGTITDPQGKPVAGAKVTLKNVATNATRRTQSSGTGAYLFDLIMPGDYSVQVEAKGFNQTAGAKVQALIAKPTHPNVQLRQGAMTQRGETRHSRPRRSIN